MVECEEMEFWEIVQGLSRGRAKKRTSEEYRVGKTAREWGLPVGSPTNSDMNDVIT